MDRQTALVEVEVHACAALSVSLAVYGRIGLSLFPQNPVPESSWIGWLCMLVLQGRWPLGCLPWNIQC